MLVITRREGEEVVIGNPASPLGVVRITSIKGDRVRIAFEFPREIAVHRREVADEIIANEATGTQILGQIRPAAEALEAARSPHNRIENTARPTLQWDALWYYGSRTRSLARVFRCQAILGLALERMWVRSAHPLQS